MLYNHRRLSKECIIREFSHIGARLEFTAPAALPDTFEVHIPSKNEFFQARATWHKGNDVGIAWTNEDAPHSPLESNKSADPLGDRVTRLEHDVAMIRKRLDALQS
ncbi:MAG: hypothetical protein ACLPKB_11950 [Xanthobacteraceae bacterium]